MAKVTIQYRQLKTEGLWEEVHLQHMVVDVLRRRRWDKNAKSRIVDLEQDGNLVILNKVSDPDSWDGNIFAGQLIQLQAGTDIHAVTQSLDEDTEEFVLESLTVSDRTKVLKGALYFVITGNHVGIIEGQQVRGRTLERYLTALLVLAGEFEPGQNVILNGKFMAGDGKELSESTEVSIAAAAANNEGVARSRSGPVVSEREAASAAEHKQATVFDVLRTLGWTEEALDSLGNEIPDDGWIEGYFKVFIKNKRKRASISRATINEALRNIDPADLGLKGDGSEKNGVVKLSVQRNVSQVGSLLDPESAMEQIVNALREWAEQGKIDCVFDH